MKTSERVEKVLTRKQHESKSNKQKSHKSKYETCVYITRLEPFQRSIQRKRIHDHEGVPLLDGSLRVKSLLNAYNVALEYERGAKKGKKQIQQAYMT